jgi:hypothetical protein
MTWVGPHKLGHDGDIGELAPPALERFVEHRPLGRGCDVDESVEVSGPPGMDGGQRGPRWEAARNA